MINIFFHIYFIPVTVPEEVHCHYVMIRQLCQFYFSILDLLSADPSSNITTELQNTLSQVSLNRSVWLSTFPKFHSRLSVPSFYEINN